MLNKIELKNYLMKTQGVEVDENQIVTTPGEIIFIPDEIHQISKDSSLKMVESGTYVTAGTEIVKDLYAHIDGVVQIKGDEDFKELNDYSFDDNE